MIVLVGWVVIGLLTLLGVNSEHYYAHPTEIRKTDWLDFVVGLFVIWFWPVVYWMMYNDIKGKSNVAE